MTSNSPFSNDKTICLWDGRNGICIAMLKGHSKDVRCIVYSEDGSRLASASYDRTIWLWNSRTGRCTAVLRGHSTSVDSVRFLADGSRLASLSRADQSVRLWDGRTGVLIVTLEGHSDWGVHDLAFSISKFPSGEGEENDSRSWYANLV